MSTSGAREVAAAFYEAFIAGDLDACERLYAEDVRFVDAIFAYEDRAGVMGMWRRLLGRPGRVKLGFELLGVEGEVARVRWTADYRLVRGRPVHNVIEARLTVQGGHIVEHVDAFDLGRWARQALPLGPLAGLAPVQWLVRRLIRSAAG